MELQLQVENNTLYMCLIVDNKIISQSRYNYCLNWMQGGQSACANFAKDVVFQKTSEKGTHRTGFEITGSLGNTIRFKHIFTQSSTQQIQEAITISNISNKPVEISDLSCGFQECLADKQDWRLIAVPFRIQVDGRKHDYTCDQLIKGEYTNSDGEMSSVFPSLLKGALRSEAWLWTNNKIGLLVGKYNNDNIEMSMAKVQSKSDNSDSFLQFGGVGFCLFGEPSDAKVLQPGGSFTFGITHYEVYAGGLEHGFRKYTSFLNSKGHALPATYNPPLNWEILYDIGWYHSDQEQLSKHFTLDKLFLEAEKAKEIGCELLYLDPGWEECEGTSLWDEKRLGKVSEFKKTLQRKYNLKFGYRDSAWLYRDEFPHAWYHCPNPVADRGRSNPSQDTHRPQRLWHFCSLCKEWKQEKIERIKKTNASGVDFMMIDEYCWFGPCFAQDHGHNIPTTASDHAKAVFDLVKSVRHNSPDVLIECHDPLWPWGCRYLPTYFKQGFGFDAAYQENWGFELMWECLKNLKDEGRAKVLYYYAMASNIPLYLQISMVTDNDQCLFFWWAASTVRHIAIGGKYHHYDSRLREKYCPDTEKRWNCYKQAVKLYLLLKEYFVRGEFHGLHEEAHLHTLDGKIGGVLTLFNISEQPLKIEAWIEPEMIGALPNSELESNVPDNIEWRNGKLHVSVPLEAASPQVVLLGDACKVRQKC
ncbi:MAG: hypothetical protein A2Y13_07150 [Planctomycetes bacterium GWC2_45_44]|nr:MAG: hypothetical protein A2Y13_07150 [Planctomycetes bacterium GWC2_45_44]